MKVRIIIAFTLAFCDPAIGFSQHTMQQLFHENYDSNYYSKLDNLLTGRLFLARKTSEFAISDNVIDKSLIYNSNAQPSVGFGFSYKWLGVNLGFGVKSPSDSIFGNTKRFDLQTQFYLRKLTINVYSSVYDGFYLQNSSEMVNNFKGDAFYHRSDIKNITFGLSSHYVFNSSRYSNRASFVQNEWQRKTAGSLLAGASIFYNYMQADSSLIPSQIIETDFLNGKHFNTSGYFAFGGDLGYALSLIFKEHWFFDFTLLGGLTFGNSVIYLDSREKMSSAKIGLSLLNRFGMGYNSRLFYVGLNYSNIQANTPLPIPKMGYGFGLGSFKLNLVYRFQLPKHKNILPDWFPGEL